MKAKIVNPLYCTFCDPCNQLAYQTPGSAGMDIIACVHEPVVLLSGGQAVIGGGVAVHIEDRNLAGMLLPRSGLGSRGIVLGNLVGLIDSDYTGEIKVVLWNRSFLRYTVQPGDRIAQLVVVRVARPQIEWVDSLDKTHRGDVGFGSTGK